MTRIITIGNETREMTEEEEMAFDAELPSLDPFLSKPYLNHGGLARFSGVAPIVIYETIRVTGVTRISKGRYRIYHEQEFEDDQYSVIPAVLDSNPRAIRTTARTIAYVEVKVTDFSGIAQDAAEVTVKIEKVITP